MILQILYQILLFLIFLLVITFSIYPTGAIVIRKSKLKFDQIESFVTSLIVGLVIFIILATVMGLLNLRVLVPIILVIASIEAIRTGLLTQLIFSLKAIYKVPYLVLISTVGVIIQGLINFPSGYLYKQGLKFWSSQGHDGLWHVSLMEEIKNFFPPSNPLFSGHPLQNYHFSSDIFMGEFYRLFPFLGSLNLYFRFYPVIFSLLIGLTVFILVNKKWGSGAAIWSMFFTYFCGSFGFIASLIKGGTIFTGETTFWASQGNTILGNPPHTLGLILLTEIVFLLISWQKHNDRRYLGLIALVGFFLATVKVSSGLILVISIIAVSGFLLVFRKQWSLLPLALFLSVTNFLLLKVISPTAQSFLIFEPLWFPRTMMVARLDWVDWELRRQHYIWVHTWRSYLRQIYLEVQAILIFLVGNTGARLVALFAIRRSWLRKPTIIVVFFLIAITTPIIIVLLFVQSGITFNLIQFMQIYLHLLGIVAGLAIYRLLASTNNKLIRVTIVILVFAFALPTTIGNLNDFYGPGRHPLALISNSEVEALRWLEANTSLSSVILTKPFDKYAYLGYKAQPIPISAWYSTSYVNALTGRHTFLTGQEQLIITGYQIDEQLNQANSFFKDDLLFDREQFLKSNNINYLYLRKDQIQGKTLQEIPKLSKAFENTDIVIYAYGQ